MKRNAVSLMIAGLLLSGCANESPLVFVSKTSVGLDVSTPAAGTSDVGISFGWKSIDAAYIPVVEIISSGDSLYQIQSGESITPGERATLTTALTSQLTTATSKLQTLQGEFPSLATTAQPAAKQQIVEQGKLVDTLGDSLIRVLDRSDALSVFSVVDTNNQIRKEGTGVGVGKIYATGLAAQFASKNYRPDRSCAEAISRAVSKLAESTVPADQAKAKDLIAACNQ